MVQTVENLPAMLKNWFRSLGWEKPLEEGMATHSSILPRESPWTEELAGCKESDKTERLSTYTRYQNGKEERNLRKFLFPVFELQ